MSETWYPIIDYEKCTGCGVCVGKCTHDVYKKDENQPLVIYPKGCVHGCHGCGNLCPINAISYAGENNCKDNSNCCC